VEKEGRLTTLALPDAAEDVVGRTKAEQEQETIVRWDREDRRVELYTLDAAQARQWARLGYDVRVVGRDPEGQPPAGRQSAQRGASGSDG